MKTILLLRHAKSSWTSPGLDDHERPLNERGEQAARAMAHHLATRAVRPDLILCSTAARTRATLAPVLDELGTPAPPIALESGLYLASEDALLERLRDLPEEVGTILLVGHNDGIGELARRLAGSGDRTELHRLAEKFPTGALAVLVLRDGGWQALGPGSCRLQSFVRPRDFDRR